MFCYLMAKTVNFEIINKQTKNIHNKNNLSFNLYMSVRVTGRLNSKQCAGLINKNQDEETLLIKQPVLILLPPSLYLACFFNRRIFLLKIR